MRKVALEVCNREGNWVRVGAVGEVEPAGSLSSDDPAGRRVFLFGWHDEQPGVWESLDGIDLETDAFRAITSLGMDRLSDLTEPFELDVVRSGITMRARFTLED